MGQARQRKAEIAELKSNTALVIDLDKIDYLNVSDINTFVKSVSGCDDRFLQLMKDLTGNDPEIVRTVDFGGRPLQCIDNAHLLNQTLGGECQRGWQLLINTDSKMEKYSALKPWEDTSLARVQLRFGFQEINQHMLVRSADGQLWDSSPSIGLTMPKQFRIFWQDDKLLTKRALDYELLDDDVYTWGMNYCYLPIAGRALLRHRSSDDLQHIVPGELCPIRVSPPKGRYRNLEEHNRRNGVHLLEQSFA